MNSQPPNLTLRELVNAVIRETEKNGDPEVPITITDESAVFEELSHVVKKANFDREMPVADLVREMDSIELGDLDEE